ncbi:MAG: hypothetical protein HXX18_15165, partial [Bacteroidetes bacterium]|nr:hypothetical protein [Bacteroidota bacterium]
KKLKADSLEHYSYEVLSLKSSFEYFVRADGIKSETFKITVVNRPMINSLELTIIPPAYTSLPTRIQKDNGTLDAIVGSIIKIKIITNRELSNALIEFSDSTKKSMRVGFNSASLELTLRKSIDYKIIIIDRKNIHNSDPITYSINAEFDSHPSIEMISPNENIKLSQQNIVQLTSKIKDDFGFSKLNLNYRLSFSKYRGAEEVFKTINLLINKSLKEEDIYYTWNTEPLVLLEGEIVSYYLEIFDNDIVGGPKSARTQIFTITVPSMEEILNTADNTQQKAEEELSKTFNEVEKLNQELLKISNDLKQNKNDISWQEKEKVEKASEKFKELTQKIEDVNNKLSEIKNNLSENKLLSKETVEKYNELQQLLDQFSSDEMKEAMKKLGEALKSMVRNN